MLYRKNSCFDVAQFMKARKVARERERERAVSENRKLLAEYEKVHRVQEKVRVLCESFLFRIFEIFVRQHYRQVVGVHLQEDL